MDEPHNKLTALRDRIGSFESCAVAFSGGVDSTFLLKVAYETLEARVIAVTALSESLPAGELEAAQNLARRIGARHVVLRTFETRDQNYLANAADRCYFCKTEMYTRLSDFASQEQIGMVVDGLNLDDLHDRRPGRAAAIERGVISPLVDAGLTKADIRALSREMGLPTWDKPAMACLSSRIPHGTPISLQALTQVDRAEKFLRELGIGQVRVRHHGRVARIEVEPHDFALARSREAEINARLNTLGFAEVVLDPDGYRTGHRRPLGVQS
jgi:pyridinium-3,5-biscarboxylic acid mononucleotide sulfurtransferase